jgi:hypothetical protein
MEFSGRRPFEEFGNQVAKSSRRFGTENFIQKPRNFGRFDGKVGAPYTATEYPESSK